MFDPEFDPLRDLDDARLAIHQLQVNEQELVRAINRQAKMIDNLSRQQSVMLRLFQAQEQELEQLKERA